MWYKGILKNMMGTYLQSLVWSDFSTSASLGSCVLVFVPPDTFPVHVPHIHFWHPSGMVLPLLAQPLEARARGARPASSCAALGAAELCHCSRGWDRGTQELQHLKGICAAAALLLVWSSGFCHAWGFKRGLRHWKLLWIVTETLGDKKLPWGCQAFSWKKKTSCLHNILCWSCYRYNWVTFFFFFSVDFLDLSTSFSLADSSSR